MDSISRPKRVTFQRLEGLVIQKRGAIEQLRYLVLDLGNGSICLYKKPPPNLGSFSSTGGMFSRSKLATSLKGSLQRSKSESSSEQGGESLQLSCDFLTHLSRERRNFAPGEWDPIFKVPFTYDWKIRDIENDELMFYLVLPPDLKTRDVETVAMSTIGNVVSYRNLKVDKVEMDSIDEDITTNTMRSDPGPRRKESTTYQKSSFKRSLFQKSFLKDKPLKQEKILTFRVLLDGNEKFIWLAAAQEVNRLANASAIFVLNNSLMSRQIYKLPPKKKKSTALRYAEWARLVDNTKSVSAVDFDPRDNNDTLRSLSADEIDTAANCNDTKLVKIRPGYAYKNRRMTLKEIEYETIRPSEKWEDFRNETVGDRDEPIIGSLHVEVLSMHGLPNLDRFSLTDAVAYVVCGPYAFATDIVDSAIHPSWPAKSRRACIFPIFYAYQSLYIGVFDNDGPNSNDDFAGRVVVDISSIRPNSSYDIYLPLRLYQNVYTKEARGVIRLRLRLEWNNERIALLSYLKRPKKTDKLGNVMTLNCADPKAFRNAIITIQGKDIPGRYKPIVQKALQREMKLYKLCLTNGMKELVKDIVLWAHPSLSGCVFSGWMHCVYTNSMSYVPVYVLLGLNALLYSNYRTFVKSEDYHGGFAPLTFSELFKCILLGNDTTTYLGPIRVESPGTTQKISRSNRYVDDNVNSLQNPLDYMLQNSSSRIDQDHVEFPFSTRGRYPKPHLAEACSDAQNVFLDDSDETGGLKSSRLARILRTTKQIRLNDERCPREEEGEDNEEEDEMKEFELFSSKAPIRRRRNSIFRNRRSSTEDITRFNEDVVEVEPSNAEQLPKGVQSNVDITLQNDTDKESQTQWEHDKVWNRMSDPLPEQDATVAVKARKTLKQEIIHNKNLMHKMTLRLFDDRIFLPDENGDSGEELALNSALGFNKEKNPVVAKMAEFIAPVLEMMKVGLSLFRASFNLLTWRDPYLTFLFQFGCIILMCVLIVFPWRLFFFLVGFGLVGPQNYFVRMMIKKKSKHQQEGDTPRDNPKKKVKKSINFFRSTALNPRDFDPNAISTETSDDFRFHNHLLTNAGIDLGDEKRKLSGKVYRAVVPSSPLTSRRFYDWPPNPSLSHVDREP